LKGILRWVERNSARGWKEILRGGEKKFCARIGKNSAFLLNDLDQSRAFGGKRIVIMLYSISANLIA
jgi:hypothetical protein